MGSVLYLDLLWGRLTRTKYFSKKVVVDGIKFDSKREANYYLKLKELEKEGKIKDLELQKNYLLQEKFKIGNKTRRSITYRADFVYYDTRDKKSHVVDVKSPYTKKDKVYRIKKKLFEYKYGVELEEVI